MPATSCPVCGYTYDASLLFCGNCGASNPQAQRIRQIEQLLADGAELASPVPPSGTPPVQGDAADRAPALRTGKAFFRRIPKRLLIWLALAAVLLVALITAAGRIRRAGLGYHASPESLFTGFQKAMEDDDSDLISELFLPGQVDPYDADAVLILDELYMGDDQKLFLGVTEFTLLDIVMGEKGMTAYIIADTKFYSPSSSNPSYETYTITLMANKRDGKWYLNDAGSFFR